MLNFSHLELRAARHPGRYSPTGHYARYIYSSYNHLSACLSGREEELEGSCVPSGCGPAAPQGPFSFSQSTAGAHLGPSARPAWQPEHRVIVKSPKHEMGFCAEAWETWCMEFGLAIFPLLFVFKDEIRAGMRKVSQVLCVIWQPVVQTGIQIKGRKIGQFSES